MAKRHSVARGLRISVAVGLSLAGFAGSAFAQEPRRDGRGEPVLLKPPMMVGAGTIPARPTLPQPEFKHSPIMHKLDGMWVQGMGYDVSYGGNYDTCAKRCLTSSQCVMIEYYRPEKKCNLYDAMRPRLKGGSSDVAIRQ